MQTRCVDAKGRPSPWANMITFMVSGFWHGFYPYYYICFFFFWMVTEVNKDIFKSRIFFQWIPFIIWRPLCG